jgi:exodeoxyribonuclease VII large subunit
MPEPSEIFTLKQVASSIQKTIAERYNRLYWVKAEMHKLNYTPKGHCYPELVHKEDGKIVADMRGQIWKTNYDRISANFAQVVKEPLRDGLTLLFQVKVTYHPLYGMSLDIMDIDPTFALGELQKEREETLKRLEKEGLLNANQGLAFPLLPKRIAIISVDSSKGLSDFYSVINKNTWGYTYFFMLFQAQLNGDAAIDAIIKQLRRIEKVREHFDVVAIIRGGGGEIGLSCYNNYALSKAIATFPLPVLTGIGHSTNITVSEMVAYKNAITPTELADFLIQCFHNFSVPVKEAQRIVKQGAQEIMKSTKEMLSQELRVFKNETSNSLKRFGFSLKETTGQLLSKSNHRFEKEKNQLLRIKDRIKGSTKSLKQEQHYLIKNQENTINKSVKQILNKQYSNLEDVGVYLKNSLPKRFDTETRLIQQLERNIHLVDPTQVLKRGYSMTLHQGKIISDENPVKEGDIIEIISYEHTIKSEIKNIKNNKHE